MARFQSELSMSIPASNVEALIQVAWGQHYRQPATLVTLGQRIVEHAPLQSQLAAWGWLHQAWGYRFGGKAGESALALEQADQIFSHFKCVAGLAACQDLQAVALGVQGQVKEALSLLDQNLSLPKQQRSAYERLPTYHRRAWLMDLLGLRDDALRDRYAMLAAARETDDPAAVAYAMGLLGGAHADQYNLDEADRLCQEGTDLALANDAFHAYALSALNHLNALVTLGCGAQALPLVKSLQAREAELSPRAREQRCIVYADVYLQTGDTSTAQALLNESVRLRHPSSQSLLSWTCAQVACSLANGRPDEARRLGEAWLANPQTGTDPGEVPSEQLRLLQNLSRACEHLGDTAGALRHQRQAFDVHDALVGRSARARRLTLEVEHQLDRERWQREQAQQRQQAAEAEGARLDQLNRALEVANHAKTRFLAAASHDLRQPVQALTMTMAALQCEALSPGQEQLVQRMGQSLTALVRMFDVLLDISRLDAGIVPVRLRTLELRALMHRLVDEHQAAANARRLTLRLRMPALHLGPLLTQTDPVLLERCLRNLLDNALKYTTQGSVMLAVRCQPHAKTWRIAVLDTGPGMDSQVQGQVFDEFYQANNPERDRTQGLGLGLSIVQRIARLLEHPLGLRSVPGHGSQFSLTLPLVTEAQSVLAGHSRVGDSGFAGLAPSGPLNGHTEETNGRSSIEPSPKALRCVAVIDDDAAVRESLVAVLERWGHAALASSDAAGLLMAWHAAGKPAVQALLVDLRLPGQFTGLHVVDQLRGLWGAKLRALVITGDMAPERLQLLNDSGLPWLAKPVMPLRLRSWLATHEHVSRQML
jgi:signal transduction histidine kinase